MQALKLGSFNAGEISVPLSLCYFLCTSMTNSKIVQAVFCSKASMELHAMSLV